MKYTGRRGAVVWLILGALTGGCIPAGVPASSPDPRSVDSEELEALYRERLERARAQYVEADVHFVAGMIGHHAQAVVMAGFAAENGASPAVQQLAARIGTGQRDEIALMEQWLRDRGLPVPQVHVVGGTVRVHGEGHASHAMHMPGMLSDEQLMELAAAHGAEFDRLFLTYMIEHHGGAIGMVDELLRADGAAQDTTVFKLASDISVDQATEIARMQQMLDALTGGGGEW
jgi:uncharacterized protein (DUF305 family)